MDETSATDIFARVCSVSVSCALWARALLSGNETTERRCCSNAPTGRQARLRQHGSSECLMTDTVELSA